MQPIQTDDAKGINAGHVRRSVERYRGGVRDRVDDAIAEEVPVAMVYNGTPFSVMMLTPAHLEDFALGFSVTEGLIGGVDDLLDIRVLARLERYQLDLRVNDRLLQGRMADEQQRLLPGRSGCGLCGARTLEDAVRHPDPVPEGPKVQAQAMETALAALRDAQPINSATGSVHAAAWVDTTGAMRMVREDVGRHNALDKLIGAMLRAALDPRTGFLLVTSRASYEMVTKAAMAEISLMVAISAPTALAIHLARSTGMTLVGFARQNSHVVYTHPQRLLHADGVRA
jgi:FdhD protein